jgi:hypothetical protein
MKGTVIDLLPDVPDAGSVSWPVAGFGVDDLPEVVRDLRQRGVAFLGAGDLPFELDEHGISATGPLRVAWMRDPDGSVLTAFSLPTA